jgi:phospholipid/cholesterol/gamma-HCH transport system substrate-binding protein
MSTRRLLPVALLVAFATTSCGLSFQSMPVSRTADGPSYRITAMFDNAARLPLGGQVRVGQATVGRVHHVSTKNFQAAVELDISEQVRLPVGTTAKLELTAALGEQYVMLRPPTRAGAGELTDGSVIPITDTARGPDVEDTLAAMGTVLNGSGIDQARTIVAEVNAAIGGREQQLRDLVHRLDDILGSLDAHSADLDALLTSMDTFAAQASANRPLIEAALTKITPAIDVLLAQKDQFTGLLADVATLGVAADGVLDETGAALTEQLRQLQPVLDTLAGFSDRLGGTLSALHTFAGVFGKAVPGDYLNLDGTLDVSGTLVQLLTGTAPIPTSAGGAGAALSGGTR